MPSKRKIGFIGLGNIGKPMAKHLIKDVFDVYVYDVFEKPRLELAALGATAVGNPKDMFQVCDHVGLCVRDGKEVGRTVGFQPQEKFVQDITSIFKIS